jgi:hypothetical protein
VKKRILLGIAAVALLAILTSSAYAQCVPTPPSCCLRTPGFTPGFWKHDIEVRLSHAPYNLGLTNAAYNAFSGGPQNGVKLTDGTMDSLLAAINTATGQSYTFAQLLAFLQGPGWSTDRTNTANWFNWEAGYTWY